MKINKMFVLLIILMLLTSCSNNRIIEYRAEGINSLKHEQYLDALNYFNMAIQAGKGQVGKLKYDILLYKAECLFMLNEYDKAKNIYETLNKINYKNKKNNELYSIIKNIDSIINLKNALDDNNIELANSIFEELRNTQIEHDKSVVYNQAVLYEKKGLWRDALNTFNYYIKQYPNDANALHEIEFINAQLN